MPTLKEHLQSMMNVILKNTPSEVVTLDFAAIEKSNAENRAARDAAKPPIESSQLLRDEYEDLRRRLTGQPPESAWKKNAEESVKSINAEIKAVEDSIRYVQELCKSPGLQICPPRRATPPRPPVLGCGCDLCLFEKRIEVLQDQLNQFKLQLQKTIRINGVRIESARELDKLRPRLAELTKIFRKIDEERRNIKGITNSGPMAPEAFGAGDHFHQQSRHLRWSPSDER